MFPLICPIIVLSIGLGAGLSGRNVARAAFESSTIWAGALSPFCTFLLQIASFCIVAICLKSIADSLITGYKLHYERRAFYRAFICFGGATLILNGIFGSKPYFNYHSIYTLITVTAVFVESNQVIQRSIEAAKIWILVLLTSSILAAIFMPDIALQRGYQGILPLLDVRLWGLVSHPNSLGALSSFFLLLLLYLPFKRRWVQNGAIVIGITTLLLAQSKTAFLAALISLGFVAHFRSSYRKRLIIISLLFFAISAVLATGLGFDFGGLHSRLVTSAESNEVVSLTGRDQIWEVAIEEWKQNPLFGYGPSIWNDEFRKSVDLDFAFSAHNQFLQSLSSAGVIGLISLLVYLFVLFQYSVHAAGKTKGLTLAIFSVIIIRCVTEAPLELGTLFTGDFLTQLVFSQILVFYRPKLDRLQITEVNVCNA
jgi:O-antigen ligase